MQARINPSSRFQFTQKPIFPYGRNFSTTTNESPTQHFTLRARQLRKDAQDMLNQGRYQEAEYPLISARELFKKANQTEDSARTSLALAYVFQFDGKLKEAEETYKSAIGSLHALNDKKLDGEIGFGFNNLAEVHWINKDLDNALACAKRSNELLSAYLPKDHPFLGVCQSNLAGYLVQKREFTAALPLAETALRTLIKQLGVTNSHTKVTLNNLNHILLQMGKKEEIKKLEQELNNTLNTDYESQVTSSKDIFKWMPQEDVELLKTDWRTTVPSVATPSGFFLPQDYADRLFQFYENTQSNNQTQSKSQQ